MELPESVAWLEHLTIEMTTRINTHQGLGKRNVLYELHLTYKISDKDEGTTWTLARTFDEYQALRRRLVKALKLGHKCNAECKWLCKVIKNHFPKVSLFCKRCPSGVEAMRLALLRMLITVQASLVNRGNLGCAIFRDNVSQEFTAFVSSKDSDPALVRHSTTASVSSSASPSKEKRGLLSSVSFTSDDESHMLDIDFDNDAALTSSRCECGACRTSLGS
ncbi:hypothetical protein BBJ28_00000817 [Nothophytophthora sp. Chile5]|nr:hypothetical protein BBJ28_00000817 [Nothophytophthora sp. Chile5]